MNLLGLQLQKAGLSFISARATHHAGGLRIDEIVCATEEDARKAEEWANAEGYPVVARVATDEEMAENARLA